jgi:hypothetical protein
MQICEDNSFHCENRRRISRPEAVNCRQTFPIAAVQVAEQALARLFVARNQMLRRIIRDLHNAAG